MNKTFYKPKTILSLVTPVLAEGTLELAPKSTSTFSPLAKITIPNLLSGAISLVLIITFVTFFFILVMGGFRWITSTGDDKKLTVAKAQITHALIGLVIILSIWAILNLIQTLFGIDILTHGISIPSFSSPYEQVQNHFNYGTVGE